MVWDSEPLHWEWRKSSLVTIKQYHRGKTYEFATGNQSLHIHLFFVSIREWIYIHAHQRGHQPINIPGILGEEELNVFSRLVSFLYQYVFPVHFLLRMPSKAEYPTFWNSDLFLVFFYQHNIENRLTFVNWPERQKWIDIDRKSATMGETHIQKASNIKLNERKRNTVRKNSSTEYW